MVKAVVGFIVPVMLFVACAACGEVKPAEEEAEAITETIDINVEVYEDDAFSFVLPEDVIAEKQEDGSIALTYLDLPFGGIVALDYENAEQLDISEITEEEGNKKFDNLISVIVPDERADYMWSSEMIGDQEIICLSVAPWPWIDDNETVHYPAEKHHYLFPKGNKFYDFFFIEELIPETLQKVMLDSFKLNS